MDGFVFQNCTKIVFGTGRLDQVGRETRAMASKILLHAGQGNALRSGLLGRVKADLSAAGVDFVELLGVQPNPRLSLVQEGIELCRRNGLEGILAVGGGSAIDSAKAIAAGVPYAGDVWDFYAGKAVPQSALPVGVVLTIPAAGSESSGSSVITKEEGWLKRGLTADHCLRPAFAILDPELTLSLPPYQTAVGAADIMSHVMERYFTNSPDVDFSDRLCEATMRALIRSLPLVLEDPSNLAARSELMWIGTVAHNDLLGMGREGDWASHDIEHELSGIYDIPHGAGLAIVFPAWMRHVLAHDPARFAQWAERVWGVEPDYRDPGRTGLEGIRRLEAFYRSCGLAGRLSELGVKDDRSVEMAAKATAGGTRTVGRFVKLDQAAVAAILASAL